MIDLTTAAKRSLDDYLREMRASLRWCPSVDSADVERDVTEHIEKSLAEAPTPVDSPALDAVLDQLGSPSQWVPEEELSWRRKLRLGMRRFLGRLWSGPEDFRLAYLTVGLLAVAVFLFFFVTDPTPMLICLGFGFLFARAALAADADHQRLGAQRWLLYPSLIVVYLPLAAVVLSWPVVAAVNLADGLHEELDSFGQISQPVLAAHLAVTCTAAWWLLLGVVLWRRPGVVKKTFGPFASGFRGWHGLMLAAVGLIAFLIALALSDKVLLGGWRSLLGD
jgi:hypothetical protein